MPTPHPQTGSNTPSRTVRPRKGLHTAGAALAVAALDIAGLPIVGVATAPPAAAIAPGSALAVIATVNIPGARDVLAVGAGPNAGDAIYAVEGSNFGGTLFRINPSTFTLDDSVDVGAYPLGIAVSDDDTVYVVNAVSDDMSVISGATMSVFSTVALPAGREEPQAVALSRVTDDTVFVTTKSGGAGPTVQTYNANTLTRQYEQNIQAPSPYGLAISRADDAYMASYNASTVQLLDNATRSVSTSAAVTRPIGVAISDDDTVYVASQTGNTVSAYPADDSTAINTVAVGNGPKGLTIGLDGTVYVANSSSATVSAINPLTLSQEATVTVGSGPSSITRTGSGLIVVGNQFSDSLSVLAVVAPTLGSTTGAAGSTATLTLGGLPAGVLADDTTLGALSFDGVPVSGWSRVAGTNSWTGAVPPGSGSVSVTVSLAGGNLVNIGNFTYVVNPPVVPAGPPTDVTVVAGDASATVSWSAPSSAGSFPITHYQVTSAPAGGMCLTTGLSCVVSRLANDTSYTFTVRALTGAGWGVPSAASPAVTPMGTTLVIAGSRGEVRGKPGIVVTGRSTGLAMGAIVVPWMHFGASTDFREGSARVLVDESGEFVWQRRAAKTIYVQMRSVDGQMVSNTVKIRRA